MKSFISLKATTTTAAADGLENERQFAQIFSHSAPAFAGLWRQPPTAFDDSLSRPSHKLCLLLLDSRPFVMYDESVSVLPKSTKYALNCFKFRVLSTSILPTDLITSPSGLNTTKGTSNSKLSHSIPFCWMEPRSVRTCDLCNYRFYISMLCLW